MMKNQIKFLSQCLVVMFMFMAINSSVAWSETLYNVCKVLPIHASASSTSKVIGVLEFGMKINVIEKVAFYDPPKTAESKNQISAWSKIDKGFVSTFCLVDKDNFDRQNPLKAKSKAKSSNIASAKKGFSEDEEGDMAAMKGAAGGATGGKANYQALAKAIKGQEFIYYTEINGFVK